MKAAEDVRPAGIQPGRGGFLRNAADVPYVTDPSGAVVKSGARKGEPKRIPYSSTSGFGTLIENRGSLEKWSERKIIEGLASNPHMAVDDLMALRKILDDAARKAEADRIIRQAKDMAAASLAADRGTHIHEITESVDKGTPAKDFDLNVGVDLGLSVAVQLKIRTEWAALLASNGLEVVEIEAAVVDDVFRCAGTLDRIVRLTRDLRFVTKAGEVVTIVAGTHLVLDIKSGSTRRTHAIQIASYAQSLRYDTENETRHEWPFVLDQDHGLIAHITVDGDDVVVELVHVDLVAGREHGGRCVVMAKEWEQRTDVFSVSQLDKDAAASVPTESPLTDSSVDASPAAPTPEGGPAQQLSTTGAAPASAPVATPAEQVATVRSRPLPAEGDLLDDGSFETLERHYKALPAEARTWVNALAREAQQAGVSFHTKGNRSGRRYSIMRALVLLAEADSHEDEQVRGLLWPIIGDCAHFPSVPVGHLVGSLSAAEAHQFARLVDGQLVLAIGDDGRPTLRPAA